MRDYYQSVLTLRWRAWMTERYVEKYLGDRNFYHIQTGGVIDNPDQRIVDDISLFTATTVGLAFTLLNAGVDLVSFSGILLGIYEPLVAVLFVYAAGGTLISAKLGQPLVGLNFQQEAREADFRYGLVRVRENAESVAFYGGEAAERARSSRDSAPRWTTSGIYSSRRETWISSRAVIATSSRFFPPPSWRRCTSRARSSSASSTRAPAPSRTFSGTCPSWCIRSNASHRSAR